MVKITSVVPERMKAKSAAAMVQALIAWERDPLIGAGTPLDPQSRRT